MLEGQNEKVIHFLLVNEQQQPLSIPLQPMIGFNIVPYETISGKHRILPIDSIQSDESLPMRDFS